MENREEKQSFRYTYSAKQQEEIQNIRKKYAAPEEDKMAQLRRLDASVTQKHPPFPLWSVFLVR